MLKILLACLFLLPSLLIGEEPIIVRLSTESKLMSLYLWKLEGNNSGLDAKYLGELEKVLAFDLNYNGMTRVVERRPEMERRASANAFEGIDDLAGWKSDNIYYLVKAKVQERKLTLRVVSINNRFAQNIEEVSLSGDLSKDRRLIHKLADAIHHLLFGSDGIASTRILYTVKKRPGGTSDATKWVSDVWEADYDGANARQITHDNCLCLNPVYVPSKSAQGGSSSFFYVSYKTGQPKIYLASLRDGQSRRFSFLPGNQLMPSITSQRDQLAFISDATSNSDLFINALAADGSAQQKPRQIFAMRHAAQASPTFSPDGRQVAFVSDKEGAPRIYIMDVPPNGTVVSKPKTTLVTKRNRENTAPAWSPDGTKIAYCSLTDKNRQIWVADLTTGQERQLTQGPGNKENPTWAADSLHLIFNSASENSSELYLVNLNQPEAIKITSGAGEKRFPCCEPRLLAPSRGVQ